MSEATIDALMGQLRTALAPRTVSQVARTKPLSSPNDAAILRVDLAGGRLAEVWIHSAAGVPLENRFELAIHHLDEHGLQVLAEAARSLDPPLGTYPGGGAQRVDGLTMEQLIRLVERLDPPAVRSQGAQREP